MREEKKAEKRQELVGVCLDCFVEKGLTVATTKDLCKAAKLQNGGIYYYFSTKEEIVLACAEEAISRIEKAAGALDIIAEQISDVADYRTYIRDITFKEGKIVVAAKDAEAESVYENYYDYNEAIASIPGHRILAINRGENEKFLLQEQLSDEKVRVKKRSSRKGVLKKGL